VKTAHVLLISLLAAGTAAPKPDPCTGPAIHVASLRALNSFRAVTQEGYVIVGTANPIGWDIGVYAPTDSELRTSLVPAKAEVPVHSSLILVDALICRDHPSGWLVPIPSSGHSLCFRLPGLKVRGAGARAHFTAGSLGLRWVKESGV